jgi:hypothetical protein
MNTSDPPRAFKRSFKLSRKLSIQWFVQGDPPDVSYVFIPEKPKRDLSGSERRALRRSELEVAAMLSTLHPENPVVHIVMGALRTLH